MTLHRQVNKHVRLPALIGLLADLSVILASPIALDVIPAKVAGALMIGISVLQAFLKSLKREQDDSSGDGGDGGSSDDDHPDLTVPPSNHFSTPSRA